MLCRKRKRRIQEQKGEKENKRESLLTFQQLNMGIERLQHDNKYFSQPPNWYSIYLKEHAISLHIKLVTLGNDDQIETNEIFMRK